MAEVESSDHLRLKKWLELLCRWTISCVFAILTQLSLLLIPTFFPSFSLISHLLFSALLLVLLTCSTQFFRRSIGVRGSAPAFVLFHIIFVSAVYLGVIRQAVSLTMDIVLNGEFVMLLAAFFRILVSDPGFVHHDSLDLKEDSLSEHGGHPQELQLLADVERSPNVTSLPSRRMRYCRSCKAYVRGFDHHCPALGNCIGQMNYLLFVLLLAGFITTEATYATCSYQWFSRIKTYNNSNSIRSKATLYKSLAVSTMLFSLLQVTWQVVFLAWNIYCICFNIRTDEWIKWRKYPEFHAVVQPCEGKFSAGVRFCNPYDKGILCNLKEFLFTRDQELNDVPELKLGLRTLRMIIPIGLAPALLELAITFRLRRNFFLGLLRYKVSTLNMLIIFEFMSINHLRLHFFKEKDKTLNSFVSFKLFFRRT